MLCSEVKPLGGVPTLHINGSPVNGIMHWNRWPEHIDVEIFHRAGVNIVSIMGNLWMGKEHEENTTPESRFDFSDNRMPCMLFDPEGIDHIMQEMTNANPSLMVMPRIRLIPPVWWKEQYKDELVLNYITETRTYKVGGWAAISSKIWRREAMRYLSETIEYFEKNWGERIIAYHTGFGDCIEHSYDWGALSDYSKPQVIAFRRWLENKYVDSNALQTAWNISDVDFSTAQIPPPVKRMRNSRTSFELYDPITEKWCIDYQQFSSELMADAVVLEAETVKNTLRKLGKQKIFGAFYAYHNLPANEPQSHFNTGHDAHRVVLECPDIDFICAPLGYANRQPGGVCTHQVLPGSIRTYGKLYYAEDDTGTHLTKHHHGFAAKNAAESKNVSLRNFLDIWSSGGTLWWMDLHGQGWFRDESFIQTFQAMTDFADRTLDKRESIAQIAVFASDESMTYQSYSHMALSGCLVEQQICEICATGAPYDIFRIEDLPELVKQNAMKQYRLCIFLDTIMLNDNIRKLIKTELAIERRTLLWLYAPGLILNDEWSEQAVSKLTGINMSLVNGPGRAAMTVEAWIDGKRIIYGPGHNIYPRLIGNDPASDVMGYYLQGTSLAAPGLAYTSAPALISRDFTDWRSIWSAAPGIPASLLRKFAKEAGVHIYNSQDNQVFAGSEWVGIHARSNDTHKIVLPEKSDVYDEIKQKKIFEGVSEFYIDMDRGETRLFTFLKNGI